MKKILFHGVIPKTTVKSTCPKCGCIFTFDLNEDTEIKQVDYNDTRRFVQCPDCNTYLEVVQ